MELKNIIAIFVVLFQFNWVVIASPTWGDPPVQAPVAFDHNETIWKFLNEVDTLYMNIDEAIEVPFDLIVINCIDCNGEAPKFGLFEAATGSSTYLGGTIINREDQFILQITQLQDYDVEVAREYRFQLFFESNEDYRIYVTLKIIDIDNRPPTIKLRDRSCVIPENEEGLGRSKCIFDISDRDTPLKELKYPLTGENDVNKHFEIVFDESTIDIDGQTGQAYLNVKEQLDFETMPTYYFEVRAEDPPKNPGSTPDEIAVKVEDMPDQDPEWKRIKTTETLKENELKVIRIFAKDGDVEVDADIGYKFDPNEPCHDSITVVKDPATKEGVITVNKIDRDEPELKDNTIKCRIFAYEETTPSANISEVISFIIEDINDNKPEIKILKDLIKINEAEFTSIPDVFSVTDIDQGLNAQFDVMLRDVGGTEFSKAFQVIPFSGYRSWSFSLSVIDADKLDYEQTEWRSFELEIYSKDQGTDPQSQEDCAKIRIQLININNKPPKFVGDENSFIVQIHENVTKTHNIIKIEATDEDTDDSLKFGLTIGDQNFEIVPLSEQSQSAEKSKWFATVITKADNVFDYEQQKQVVIQISATDELLPGTIHTVVQQITIEVLDVNDESPRITLPNETPEIKEHQKVGCPVVTPNFKAIDVDTTAELKFKIIWDESYATRQGARVKPEKFKDVFTIETTYEVDNEGNEKKGYADATLKVNDELRLDYEEYEIIYLKIQVQDIKQEIGIGFDSAIMAVTIQDINDHAPQFTELSIKNPKSITENSTSGTLIGSIIAIDPDGPGFNKVSYSIEPRDGLVKIDEESGELTVEKDKAIDADCPDTFELYYKVTATDSELKNVTEIIITINDINDIDPSLVTDLQSPFKLEEGNYSNYYLQTINGIDFDRDNPHNNISYYLNGQFGQTLHDYFRVDEISGKIYANNTFVWSEEREIIKVDLIIKDSFGGNEKPLELSISFDVIIEDINDNRPILDQNIILEASEVDSKDKFIKKIEASDKDKPCTPHTQINYKIDEIKDPNKDVVTKEILRLENKHEEDKKCQYYANLYTNMALREFYGTYSVCIIAENIGKEDLNDRYCYDLVITPYNFKPPKMIYPLNGGTIVLDKDQTINKKLLTPDGSQLTDFEATDDQGGKFTMILHLKENYNDMFILKDLGQNNKAQLQLKKLPEVDDKKITLTIEAEHNGVGSTDRVVQSTFTIYFIDKSELPYFEGETDLEDEITENEKGVCRTFKKAVDGKCIENPDCGFTIYYYQTEENEKKFFTLNETEQTEPQLCIINPLDREEHASHNLTIYASNTPNSPPIGGLPTTPLNIKIKVKDVNDNAPVFDPKTYDGGITIQTTVDTVVVRQLTATDIDTIDEGKLRYTIVESSFVATGSNLGSINSQPFKIPDNTQDIVNTFQPQAKMSGYFSFTVRVFDSNDLHDDNATVKILIISEVNQIELKFGNEVEDVRRQQRSIEAIFSEELDYTCVIDNTVNELDDVGTPKDKSAIVIAHFIDDDKHEAADKDIVTEAIKDNHYSIGKKLLALNLNFTEFVPENLSDIKSSEELLETLLIVVSVVLGTLIIVLIIAFVLRTRSLNQRIASMTTNVFGSTKSDLNRIGTNAPGTNRHAVEANPVWNEEINDMNHFDTISQASGGSGLIGIEDNPEFQYNRKDSINPGFEQNNNITFDDNDDDDDDIISLSGPSSNNQFKFA